MMKVITEIAKTAKIDEKFVDMYGKYKAKIDLSIMDELKDKKIILYAPTFRTYDEYKIEEIINAFKYNSKYQLIIKKHPRMKVEIPSKYSYDNCSSLELLSISDYVITDYSAISIEAAILNKKVLLYTYDYDILS